MRERSEWSKKVKHALLDRNMTIVELAKELGMTREYITSVVNERTITDPARKRINDYLNIIDD